MPAPAVDLQHLKTSKQYNGSSLITRYWFQWQNRKNLSSLIVRVDLLDDAGNVLTNASLQLPKTKINGYVPATETEPQKPIYDGSVWIQLDDIVRDSPATQYRFYTVTGLFNKSETVTGKIEGIYEDISYAG